MPDTRSDNQSQGEIDAGRRELIRKAAYTAPALVALGFAAHSGNAKAQFPPPPSAPDANSANPEPTEEELLLQELDNRD